MEFKNYEDFKVSSKGIRLKDYPKKIQSALGEEKTQRELEEDLLGKMKDLHRKLFAEEKSGVVVVLQALDAAGKDEVIEYIFSSLLPQGLKNTPFGAPTEEEKSHDYLWRMAKAMPRRGQLGIFNRSYYEDIISPVVHQSLEDSKLPEDIKNSDRVLEARAEQIRNYEKYLYENGFPVVKFFFNMSKEEQAFRLIDRIEKEDHNFEFSPSDIDDRQDWDKYHEVFDFIINSTASPHAPWYVLPADNPWASRKIVTQAIIEVIEGLDPAYPTFSEEEKEKYKEISKKLKSGDL